ncbi:Ferric siderophore transport system, periplasmic binding protein TonB [Candidatus Burkholderia pumila]|uniref:Ferric siderophore transport system, periplasmic binding protein TonB n=1 Tax=Candidatus Burkholderia pumila TaxID=1090375 RepID=A0ABR5HJZ7_9BURK|nr:Ferric siderophore transport system, periplasmic binding protein TonB [Candidatus Burkholderia pumila]
MQAPTTSPAAFQTAQGSNGNPRVIAACAIVLALHAALFGVALSMRDKPLPKPIEAKSITAMMISETPQPAPQSVAVETPQPKPEPKPIPKPKMKPKIEPKPAPAPAIGKSTMDVSAPKNVAHLSCNIAQPDYPAMAKRRGETGTATVKLTVGLTGKIENVTLQKSSGSSRLDDAAMEAVRGSACSPYKENGEAIRATATVPFVFNLND